MNLNLVLKIFLVTLMFSCLVPLTVSAVVNGDFETGDFTGWDSSNNFDVNSTDPLNGTYSVYSFVPLDGYVYQGGLGGLDGYTSVTFSYQFDSDSGIIGISNDFDAEQYITYSDGNIHTQTIYFVTPTYDLYFSNQGTGTFRIDDVTVSDEVEPTPTPTPTETPLRECQNVTVLGINVEPNSTSWNITAENKIWGVDYQYWNEEDCIANVTHYVCTDPTLVTAWHPVINPSTDTKFDFIQQLKDNWYWLLIIVATFAILRKR